MTTVLLPPFDDPAQADVALQRRGYAVWNGPGVEPEWGQSRQVLMDDWWPYWDELPADAYLRDGGRYRRRRHGSFLAEEGRLEWLPQRPHWQPLEYNALHGGIERHFELMPAPLVESAAWQAWLRFCVGRAEQIRSSRRWFIEAHMFRIDTSDGIGRPTPEGAHRDGVDLVVVTLLRRHNIKGGETRVFAAQGREGLRFTLSQPGDTVILDDARVIHETTPIQPVDPVQPGFRDTLVITLRAEGFQGPLRGE